QPLLHAEESGPGEMCMSLHGLHVKVEELTEYRLQVVTHVRCGGCLCHDGLALAYSCQLLLRMMATKSSRTNDRSRCAGPSRSTVPKVVLGRCFMPSVNACRMQCLKSGRGCAAVTADNASGDRPSLPKPSPSVSTPAVTQAISGSRNS